jgi:predicted nucleotidyltransferase
MCLGLARDPKAETFIETPGGIHLEHPEPHRQARLLRLGEDAVHEVGPDSAVLLRGEEEDAVDADLVGLPAHEQAPDRAPLPLDDLVGRGVRGCEEPGALLFLIPGAERLLDVGAERLPEKNEQQLHVVVTGDAQRELVGPTRTPPGHHFGPPLLGRERAGELHAALDPLLELLRGTDSRGVHVDHALQRPTREIHLPDVTLGERRLVSIGPHPHHQVVVDDSTEHVSVQKEGESTEHFLLADPAPALHSSANPLRELLVVGHPGSPVGRGDGLKATMGAVPGGRTMQATPYPDLDALLRELTTAARGVLGTGFVAAYLHGSFAMGDFDEHSDVDFLVAVDGPVSADREDALQAMHGRLFDLDSRWAKRLDGSYVPLEILRRHDPMATELLYLDNGSRELVRSSHCNRLVIRWMVREHGIPLEGPDPRSLIDPIPVDALRRQVARDMHAWAEEIGADPLQMNNRWYQPYAVLSYCRMLYTLEMRDVVSKPVASRWALNVLGEEWGGLIQRALDQRPHPARRAREAADPTDFERTLAFIDHALERARAMAP